MTPIFWARVVTAVVWSSVVAYSLFVCRVVFHVEPGGWLAILSVFLFGLGIGFLWGLVLGQHQQAKAVAEASAGVASELRLMIEKLADGEISAGELGALARVVPMRYPDPAPTEGQDPDGKV